MITLESHSPCLFLNLLHWKCSPMGTIWILVCKQNVWFLITPVSGILCCLSCLPICHPLQLLIHQERKTVDFYNGTTWNYWSDPKVQRYNRWSLGMAKTFHPTIYWACNYLSLLGSKLNRVNKWEPWAMWNLFVTFLCEAPLVVAQLGASKCLPSIFYCGFLLADSCVMSQWKAMFEKYQ